MSKTMITPLLGQDDAIEPQPLVNIPEDVYGGLQAVWNAARESCLNRFTPAQCRAVFGSRPTFLEDSEGPAWYVWLGIGLIVGKVVL